MLEVINLACHRGERRLFSNVCFSVGSGGLLAVVGGNGSGKTSLLRLLCGVLPPDQGVVAWRGHDIARQQEWYRGQLTYIGHLNGIKAELTASENLASAARLTGARVSRGAVGEALHAVGMGDAADLPTRVLSQGQKRRVALARLWLSTCPLWILDEPYAALDAAAAGRLTGRVEEHLGGGGTVVLTAHRHVDMAADVVRELRLAG